MHDDNTDCDVIMNDDNTDCNVMNDDVLFFVLFASDVATFFFCFVCFRLVGYYTNAIEQRIEQKGIITKGP